MNNSELDKTNDSKTPSPNNQSENRSSRRRFLGTVGAALAGGAVLGKIPQAAAQSLNPRIGDGVAIPDGVNSERARQAFQIRVDAAAKEAVVPIPPHTTNGDEDRYPDKSGTYSKALLQDGIGLVNKEAYKSFRAAINAGTFAAFETIIAGGTRTQNGPLGGRAFPLEGTDDGQFGNATSPQNQINQIVVPPAPKLAGPTYGTELVELYWLSLLRDVPFTDFATNPIVAQACAELTSMPKYLGPRDVNGNVTPDLLARGTYPGDTIGPYISQFMLMPTFLGVASNRSEAERLFAGPGFHDRSDNFPAGSKRNSDRCGRADRSDRALRHLGPRPRHVHSSGCALPSLFRCIPRAANDPRTAESGYSLRQLNQTKRLRDLWRAGHCRDPDWLCSLGH